MFLQRCAACKVQKHYLFVSVFIFSLFYLFHTIKHKGDKIGAQLPQVCGNCALFRCEERHKLNLFFRTGNVIKKRAAKRRCWKRTRKFLLMTVDQDSDHDECGCLKRFESFARFYLLLLLIAGIPNTVLQ